MKLISHTDFDDLIRGAKILGCGGGGEELIARTLSNYILESDLIVNVIDPKDIPDDALLCVSGIVGGRSTQGCFTDVHNLKEIESYLVLAATRFLESFLNSNFHTIIPTEIGAGNFLVPILTSAFLGINVLDGDLCGRAKPEISISTSNLMGIPITPLAIVSPCGDQILLKRAQTDQRAERIAREIAVLSGGIVGVARCPAYWKDYKQAIIPNTLSKAIALGAAIRIARENNHDLIQAILKKINGKVIFYGSVEQFLVEDKGGFVIGTILLRNKQNDQFKIWFKNEFLVTWINEKPLVTSPDLICIIDPITGEGLTPWADDFHFGRIVIVLGSAAAPLWYCKKGIELFGPKHFDFEFEFKPFDKIIDKIKL